MYKVLDFPTVDEHGVHLQLINPGVLEKTAGLRDEVAKFIETLKPDSKKYLYLLLNAMGSSEHYGQNSNGDIFPEHILTGMQSDDESSRNSEPYTNKPMLRYKTFLMAKTFRGHQNKDINRAYGEVLATFWNPIMKRVELVITLDRDKAPDLCEAIEKNQYPNVSMGARVKSDFCTICNHEARTRLDYCTHTRYHMGEILPDGRRVGVINKTPRFFDISFVKIGADKTARVLLKVASQFEQSKVVSSAEQAEKLGYVEEDKNADIKKQIPVEVKKIDTDMPLDELAKIEAREPDLSDNHIKKIAEHDSFKDALASLAAAGIVLKPHEFQKIALMRAGETELANELYEKNIAFDALVEHGDEIKQADIFGNVSDDFAGIVEEVMPERSVYTPYVNRRAMLCKMAAWDNQVNMSYPVNNKINYDIPSNEGPDISSTKNLAKFLAPIAALYYIYRKSIPGFIEGAVGNVDKSIATSSPIMSALMLAGLVAGATGTHAAIDAMTRPINKKVTEHPLNKQAAIKSPGLASNIIGIPFATYTISTYLQNKAMRGEPLTPMQKDIAINPGKWSAGILGARYLGMPALKKLTK